MKLEKTIKDAIEQQLPTQVGTVLKERLARLEELEQLLEKAEEQNKRLESDNAELHKRIDEWKEALMNHDALDVREEAITRRENQAGVEKFKLKAEEAEKRAGLAKEFVSLIFRNTTLRETAMAPVSRGPDSYIEHHTTDKTKTEE